MPSPRRLIALTAIGGALLVLTVPSALGQSLFDKQSALDTKISGLRDEISRAREKEGVLTSEIDTASSKISVLEGRIDVLGDRLAVLERELAAHRARLERLRQRLEEQTRKLERLRAEHAVALQRLNDRIVALYQSPDTTELDVLFQAESLTDLIEQLDYFNQIGAQDKAIADELKRLKVEMRLARQRTVQTEGEVEEATAVLAEKTEQERAAQAALVAQQDALASLRAGKQSLLADVQEHRHEAEEDLAAMQAASASLAARIRAAQSSSPAPLVGGGGGGGAFIWPTSGVLTSGFGPRWGRMHEGIDIAAPCGTGVVAAAGGNVIYAGWMGGYGNIVVIDHGGGISTAYAHLSGIAAGGSVGQGQGVGAVGTTGSSTGCHLHFEVRVNGSAVDPMGYL